MGPFSNLFRAKAIGKILCCWSEDLWQIHPCRRLQWPWGGAVTAVTLKRCGHFPALLSGRWFAVLRAYLVMVFRHKLCWFSFRKMGTCIQKSCLIQHWYDWPCKRLVFHGLFTHFMFFSRVFHGLFTFLTSSPKNKNVWNRYAKISQSHLQRCVWVVQ